MSEPRWYVIRTSPPIKEEGWFNPAYPLVINVFDTRLDAVQHIKTTIGGSGTDTWLVYGVPDAEWVKDVTEDG